MKTKQAPEKVYMEAEKREVFGKGVKTLRKAGLVPANIYGKDFKSLSIVVPMKVFQKTFTQVGETGVVYITVGSEEIPTLIREVQYHPLTESILHIDFRKINLRQKIETQVPFEFINESPATKQGALVLYQMDEITIEALPAKIPSEITIDLETLTEIGQEIKISDIPASEDYEILEDPERVIVMLTEHVVQSEEPDTTSTIPSAESEADESIEGEATEQSVEAEKTTTENSE